MNGSSIPFLHALVVSISVGALIGLIRQWSDEHEGENHETSAGIRTHALWSLLGFLSAYLHQEYADYFFPVSFATFGIFLIAANNLDKSSHRGLGLTSYSAAILSFLVGSLIFWQQLRAAIAIAIAVGILLAAKPIVHSWTRKLTKQDIVGLLQFLAVTGLILPLVPNRGFGPLEAFNPYNIWLMVILISGLGFVGYVAMRLLGTQAGITVTGLAGGLASSTATTLALARNSRQEPAIAATLASGIVIANTVMIARIGVIILAINPKLCMQLIVPLVIIALPTTLLLLWHFLLKKRGSESVDLPTLRNPLSLKLAIKFAVLYALIVFLVKAVVEHGDGAGFYTISFISGLTDMDAIALSLANEELAATMSVKTAAAGIIIGAFANTLFKSVIGVWLGHPNLRRPLLSGMIPMLLAGGLALLWVLNF